MDPQIYEGGSYSSTAQYMYDVFLSFRGEDTRYNFTSHLYKALHDKGFKTFFDDDNLPKGEAISKELPKAIKLSKISIVVFSENYASSTWCLRELVQILDCCQTVLPVFYKINPSEVRKQKGKFGIALTEHEKENRDKVQSWRAALTKAADLVGFSYEDGCSKFEAQFIEEIIGWISRITSNLTTLFVAEYQVGIGSRVKEIELLLDTKSNVVRKLGIHGLGGVGKTTIAKAVYNKKIYHFDRSCFLEDVREKSSTINGIIQLQQTLLFKILQDPYLKVDNISQGIELIMGRLCHTRLLLILDDVDKSDQIGNLLGRCDWFSSGSIIIITTRDKQVLTTLGKDHLGYEVKGLNQREAHELFSRHTFQMNKPGEDYSEVAKQIIHYANGLPLALKVIGSDLCGRSIHEWEDALEKHKKIPPQEIQGRLKISYDGLEKTERDIFLHVACFFKGFEKDYVIDVLETCNLCPRYGIRKLIDKCLITVDQYDILSMHDLLQQMGREIVRQEDENHLENRSRIWYYEDAYKVLTENMGTDKIQAMMLCSPEPVTMKLQGEPFERMKNLKFLLVKNVLICGEFQYLPNELRFLEWHEFPFYSWPSKYCPQKLVALNIRWSSPIGMEIIQGIQFNILGHMKFESDYITEFPKLCAPNLKTLDLSFCLELVTVHELFAPSLETLHLCRCDKLVTVHESVGFLDRLRIWELQGSKSLQNLPNNLRLKSLEKFVLSGCSKLEKFPNIHQEMKRLKILYLSESGIRGLPSSIGYLTQLTKLGLIDCHNLRDLPDSICKLQMLEVLYFGTAKLRAPGNSFDGLFEYGFPKLRELIIGECGIDLEFLMKPNYFPVLKVLELSGSDIVSIPKSLSRFTALESLEIENCKQLRQILRLPQFIKHVEARNCPSLDAQYSLNQIGEILCEGERSHMLVDDLLLDDYSDARRFIVPYTEIPRWLNCKHQSVGNSISFHVGRKFPNVFAFYFAFGLVPLLYSHGLRVYLSINGFEKVFVDSIFLQRRSDDLWELSNTMAICYRSHLKLQKLLNESNPSDYNHVEVTYEWEVATDDVVTDDEVTDGEVTDDEVTDGEVTDDEVTDYEPFEIRRWGVKVECICCPKKSSISSSMALTLVDNDSHSDLNLPLKKRRKY